MSNTNTYKRVIITKYNERGFRFLCPTEKDYRDHLLDNPDMAEVIGDYGQQIKPIIDIDAFNDEPNIDSIIKELNNIFPNKEIKYAKRAVRDTKKGKKYSYRFYIQGVRMLSKNVKQLLIENGLDKDSKYDLSIYDKNKILFLPLTTRKVNEDVPPLTPINGSIFECCASYIQEDFEDYDVKIKSSSPIIIQEPEIYYKKVETEEEEDNDNEKGVDFIKNIISKLSSKRASDYNDWTSVVFAIIGACKKSKIGKTTCSNLIHQFSQLSLNKYDEYSVDKWIDENYKRQIERIDNQYSYNFLIHNCLKEDDSEKLGDRSASPPDSSLIWGSSGHSGWI